MITRSLEVVRRILNVAHQDWRWLKGVPKIRMLKEPRRRRRSRHTLNADAVAALEATRGQHPRWCFTFSGKRIQQSSTAWDKAKQRAGIEDFRFHDLRHIWASWHVQSGTSLPELMELGGWKAYEMVLRYAHLAPENLSFVAGRIERQASRPVEEAPHVKNVAKNATFSLRSVN
jgi:integrase